MKTQISLKQLSKQITDLINNASGGVRQPVEFTIDIASNTWNLQHNFNDQYPNVFCFDDDGSRIFGEIEYYSQNLTIVHFDIPIKGKAIVK